MIKDYLDSEDYNDLEIKDSKIAGKIFRDFVDRRDGRITKIDKNEISKISEYYNQLTDKKKKIVWHMITCLLPESKREQNLKGYLAELMKERNITRAQLINMIIAQKRCANFFKKEPVNIDETVIKSKIQNFLQVMNPDKESYLLEDVCRLLNVDVEAITTGYGKEYSIDEANLARIIESKGENVEQYVQEFVNDYIPCDICKNKKICKSQDYYFQYLVNDKQSFAELLSDVLDVPLKEILSCDNIVIAADNLSFGEYYNKLSQHDRETIYFLICDLLALED